MFGRSRLGAAATALVAACALVLAGCSSSDGDTSSDQAWSFTDDLGQTVTLDHAPERIAGQNDLLAPLMEYGVSPIASFGFFSIEEDGRFSDFDTSGITEVGTSYGEINLDELALAKPDVILATIYPMDENGTLPEGNLRYGLKDLAQQEQLEKIAPIVTIYVGGEGKTVLDRIAELDTALGADSTQVDAAKQEFDTASQALTSAASKSEVLVTPMYADADGLYTYKADDEPTLQLYKSLGVNFFEPTPEGYYWGIYSWENATEVTGDVVLLAKDGYQLDDLKAQRTLAGNLALNAGQVHPYNQAPMDYASQASYMTDLAGWIQQDDVLR
ncbi:ABC transporter substrate-binding protein [Rhodococcoides kyotonense]|uniref:Iron complex transport system substrate-binding protein n=1 Tax=Rhodococcoides kyotonense TaxID=398843 RepID=A0A239L6A6_9NOCA|nr:ABC transporter substrate-binding protein [Rhodococcus kyotonensis]SNT25448.1 iron complex transport system substrate-binding protein [Rhodococcus kyotonensis]